jgi:hypothetical protein
MSWAEHILATSKPPRTPRSNPIDEVFLTALLALAFAAVTIPTSTVILAGLLVVTLYSQRQRPRHRARRWPVFAGGAA